MPETFTIEGLSPLSSDSLLEEDPRREGRLDYGRNRGRLPPSGRTPRLRDRRNTYDLDLETNQFMDVLLFCSAMVLWMSGIVMLAFGFYLALSEYGWAVLTGSTMYWVGMILQSASALCILIGAFIITTLLTPDTGSPKRVLLGFLFVMICALLLISEIIVCSISKKNQKLKAKNYYFSILNTGINNTLSEQALTEARKKGYECKKWDKERCNELYRKYTEMFINFLIGSASVTLGIIILVIPVLYFVYRTTVRKITQVRPSQQVSQQSLERQDQRSSLL